MSEGTAATRDRLTAEEERYEVLRLFRLLDAVESDTPSNETVMINVNLIRRLVRAFETELQAEGRTPRSGVPS